MTLAAAAIPSVDGDALLLTGNPNLEARREWRARPRMTAAGLQGRA